MMTSDTLRIAVIEDNAAVLDSLLAVLRLRKHEGTGFLSAEVFLNDMESHRRFDCLIVDYRLNGMSGLSLIATLRDSGNQTPVILMSGNLDEQAVMTAKETSNVLTLRKPCPPKSVLTSIELLTDRGTSPDSSQNL